MALTLDGDNGISGINGSAATPAVQGTDTNTGLTFGTDTVGVVTGGTTRTTVDSSGRLLVGTSTARTNVDFYGTAVTPSLQYEGTTNNTSTLSLIANSTTDSVSGQLRFGKSSASGIGNNGAVVNNEVLGRINFSGSDGTNFYGAAEILSCCDGTPSTKVPGRLQFYTGGATSDPAERARIDNAGRITFSNLYDNTSATGRTVLVQSSGELVASTSSIKYKTSVETIDDSYADAVLEIRPVWYKSLCAADNPDWGWWGFIAEEVAQVDPRLVQWKTSEVSHDENGSAIVTELDEPEPEGVYYDRFVPHLLNLIKRQKEAIEALETRVAQLEGGAA